MKSRWSPFIATDTLTVPRKMNRVFLLWINLKAALSILPRGKITI